LAVFGAENGGTTKPAADAELARGLQDHGLAHREDRPGQIPRFLVFGPVSRHRSRRAQPIGRTIVRDAPTTSRLSIGDAIASADFAKMVERAGIAAKLEFKTHPHMLRHGEDIQVIEATVIGAHA
jgi:hypothetical protein